MLTTPRQATPDSVFPEENWFFYWKTSPSLWKSKLENYRSSKPLIVPVYWGVHTQAPQVYDFGTNIPETDLSKIAEYASELGIRLIFGLGITPLPFLANGGLPSFLSKNLSLDKNKMGLATLDASGTLNKMYSFYDPRVFQAYKKFLVDLKSHIFTKNLDVDFIGLKGFYLDQDQCESFLNDFGLAYEQGFNRFVDQKMHTLGKNINELIQSTQDEMNLKREFENLIYDLYNESFKELFGKQWLGSVDLCFLGASVEDLIERTQDLFETASHYVHDVFQIHSMNKVPCSVLIPHEKKTEVLLKSLADVNNDDFYNNKLHYDFYEGEDATSFESCTFFKLINNFINEDVTMSKFKELGLQSFLQKEFRWSYKLEDKNSQLNFDDIDPHDIFFFFGEGLQEKQFSKMVKIFLGGGKVLLDKSQINEDFYKKLDMFFLENEFKTEHVNYLCDIQHVQLDEEGVFVIYDGRELEKHSLNKKYSFWERIIRYFNISHPVVEADADIEFFWGRRNTNSMELNFQEIRRVSFYNPGSYKKKAKINTNKSFALRKIVDEKNAAVHSNPMGVEIEIAPGGSVSLDYGYFESR